MAAAQAPASRTRRYVYGGLLAAAAVAIGLALIFTVGGAGKKEAKSIIEPAVEQLDDHTAISDVLKDLTAKEEAPATTTVTPVAPAAPAPAPGMNIGTFTPVRTCPNCRPEMPAPPRHRTPDLT
jgi:hypothetical protein